MLRAVETAARRAFTDGRPMSEIRFETLGCRLNQSESEGAARAFADAGFSVTLEPLVASSDKDDAALLCVVNTCTVTAKAEQKARRVIRTLLTKCPNAAVCVTGCYAQVESAFLRSMDTRVCVLVGQHKDVLADVPALLALRLRKRNGEDTPDGAEIAATLQAFFNDGAEQPVHTFRLATDTFVGHSRASLKVQDGCNGACTYCRIRLARGASVSLSVEEAVARARALEKAGQAETVITTVNIAQYRAPWQGGIADFAVLLEELLSATERIRFRISSLHPEIVDHRLTAIIAHPRVQPHFHLSVQSGSNAVLARMKRPYRADTVYRAVELLRQAKDDPFLACDIIAGFPGETDEDFALTQRLCDECGFAWVHAFPFSPRPGTEAFSMRPMVANTITNMRMAWLKDFAQAERRMYITRCAEKTFPAVCESVRRAPCAAGSVVHAVSSNFLHCTLVFADGRLELPSPGDAITVRVRRPLSDDERIGERDTLAELVAPAISC